jgi:murein tripeptide amidase MpaA
MKVLSVNFRNKYQMEEFLKLSEELYVDIWKLNNTNAEFMVQDRMVDYFDYYHPQILIENVQEFIEKTEQQGSKNGYGAIFDNFPSYSEVNTWVNEQISKHQPYATSITIGKTYSGTDIKGIRIARNPEKPIFYIHCTIHAREWITTTTCLWIIDQLLNQDPAGVDLLNNFQWIFVPVFNVDGYEYTRSSSNNRLWRKNRQPNSGSSCVGTDLNRNYPNHWGGAGASSDPCSETYRGSSASSSPEITVESNYLKSIFSNLVAFVDIHSYGGYFMCPWGWTNTLPADYNTMLSTLNDAAAAIRLVNGASYTVGASGRVLYATSGGSNDFTYGDGKVVHSYVVEVSGNSFIAPTSDIPRKGAEVYAGIKSVAGDIISAKDE